MPRIVLSLLLLFFVLIAGCATKAQTAILPSLPASYYNCIVAQPDDLMKAYFTRYYDATLAAQNFNGKIFVFKDVHVNSLMLNEAKNNILDVGTIQCVGTLSGAAQSLVPDSYIDVVGINQGPSQDPAYEGWLIFTGCYFLPASAIALPAGGAGTMGPLY